jgi:hypothetical protein
MKRSSGNAAKLGQVPLRFSAGSASLLTRMLLSAIFLGFVLLTGCGANGLLGGEIVQRRTASQAEV